MIVGTLILVFIALVSGYTGYVIGVKHTTNVWEPITKGYENLCTQWHIECNKRMDIIQGLRGEVALYRNLSQNVYKPDPLEIN